MNGLSNLINLFLIILMYNIIYTFFLFKIKMGKRKHTTRKQHIYNMHGCSRMRSKRYSRKHMHRRHLGGNNSYSHTYPNKGPAASSQTIYNSVASQYGGCGGTCPLTNPVVGGRARGKQLGGKCACGLPSFGLFGGAGAENGSNIIAGIDMNGFVINGEQHRNGCQCTDCKVRRHDPTVDDITMQGGNSGLVGKPWTSNPSSWPSGHNGNHYKQNMLGGSASNFMSNDLVNLGRQMQYGVGSAYNALAGYSAPVNPLPWKGQLQPR